MTGPALVLVVLVAVLFAAGFDLLMQRSLIRVVVGFMLLGHGANLVLLLAGGAAGTPPILGEGVGPSADPLPQAMALTAIVITFGVTAFLLALAYRSRLLLGEDEVMDDVEDRRICAERRRRREDDPRAEESDPLEEDPRERDEPRGDGSRDDGPRGRGGGGG
ncbi:Na(+)/H(+) antiporter subunit C [Actinomadura sp. KC06]|uniref:Na(+)/H(+) antiporter subunit C n=1 Tax=Actinomadura sp. KC06 TaxID=2530369 RepID=UPI0010449F7F|nr:Na(+)/H(+) antiporter subunit C [Actinomadura sp. KC06]TDD24716.1 Na(+)/H(+) antiporter subunit C [Actinomadura sp. KC06]